MTFVVKMLSDQEKGREAFQACEAIVGSKINLRFPLVWLADESLKYNFFSFGGRGEMPAVTGAPPFLFILGLDSCVYQYELRTGKRIKGEEGGVVHTFIVEGMKCIAGEQRDELQVNKVMEEALMTYLINTGWRELERVVLGGNGVRHDCK